MRSDAFGGDAFDSNILRNTEHAALLIAAAADTLATEAKLTTAEPEMVESMASVVRGLIGLTTFSDNMDEELLAVLRGTRVDTKDNNLSISIAVDPGILVTALRD